MALSVSNDDDESDYYKFDPFEGIDFDTIPELSQATASACGPPNAERNGRHDSTVHERDAQLQLGADKPCKAAHRIARASSSPHNASTENGGHSIPQLSANGPGEDSPSTEYSDDVYTTEFLAQLDSLESAILEGTGQTGELASSHTRC